MRSLNRSRSTFRIVIWSFSLSIFEALLKDSTTRNVSKPIIMGKPKPMMAKQIRRLVRNSLQQRQACQFSQHSSLRNPSPCVFSGDFVVPILLSALSSRHFQFFAIPTVNVSNCSNTHSPSRTSTNTAFTANVKHRGAIDFNILIRALRGIRLLHQCSYSSDPPSKRETASGAIIRW